MSRLAPVSTGWNPKCLRKAIRSCKTSLNFTWLQLISPNYAKLQFASFERNCNFRSGVKTTSIFHEAFGAPPSSDLCAPTSDFCFPLSHFSPLKLAIARCRPLTSVTIAHYSSPQALGAQRPIASKTTFPARSTHPSTHPFRESRSGVDGVAGEVALRPTPVAVFE